MREAHLLQRTASASYPSQVVALEVETDAETPAEGAPVRTHRLTHWVGLSIRGARGVYDAPRVHSGRTADALWDELLARLAKSGQITVISHNALRTWTVLGLWDRLTDHALRLSGHDWRKPRPEWLGRPKHQQGVCVVDGPPTIIDVRLPRGGGTLRIVDIDNWGVGADRPEFTARGRCERTLTRYLGIVRRLRGHNLGGLKWTAASQAMHSYRYAAKDCLVECHTDERVMQLERAAYYGGRAEAMRLGTHKGPVYHLDVSSQYRAIYAALTLPTRLVGVERAPAAGLVGDLIGDHGCIAEVSIRTESPDYPVRVAMTKMRADLPGVLEAPRPWTGHPAPSLTVWPIGEYRTTLAGPELLDAHARGRITAWHWIAWYHCEPALADYADRMSRLLADCASDPDARAWAKMLANCLVGKLGQSDRAWVDAPWPHVCGPWDWFEVSDLNRQVTRWRSIGWRSQVEVCDGWANEAVPAMAAWVTSAARVQLLAAIRAAGRNHCYYCVTDSVFVDRDGFEEMGAAGLVDEGAAGFWRVEGVHDSLTVHGVGHYELDGRVVCAGMPGSGQHPANTRQTVWTTPSIEGACKARRVPAPIEVARASGGHGAYRHGVPREDGEVLPHIMEGD